MAHPMGTRQKSFLSWGSVNPTLSRHTRLMNDPIDSKRQAEFVRLLNASHRRLLGYLVSLLGNVADAEDALQRASVTLWQKFDTFELGTDFLAWASTVAYYEARNFQRLHARSRLVFSDELLKILADERQEDMANVDPRRDALEKCLGELDSSAQQLLEAAYLEQGSVATLAETLGRAPQTIYNKLNVLRRRLSQCVEDRIAREIAASE